MAGPSASAAISINRKPAACASVAVRQKALATRNVLAHICRAPDEHEFIAFIDVSSVLRLIDGNEPMAPV
jgi:hypothetical protein